LVKNGVAKRFEDQLACWSFHMEEKPARNFMILNGYTCYAQQNPDVSDRITIDFADVKFYVAQC
jgi:hypothetical protein